MATHRRSRPLLNLKPMKALAGAVLVVPLMACNYKGPAYDCADEDIDEETGYCATDAGTVEADGGESADAGQTDGGETPDDAGIVDAGIVDAGIVDAGIDDAGSEPLDVDAGE